MMVSLLLLACAPDLNQGAGTLYLSSESQEEGYLEDGFVYEDVALTVTGAPDGPISLSAASHGFQLDVTVSNPATDVNISTPSVQPLTEIAGWTVDFSHSGGWRLEDASAVNNLTWRQEVRGWSGVVSLNDAGSSYGALLTFDVGPTEPVVWHCRFEAACQQFELKALRSSQEAADRYCDNRAPPDDPASEPYELGEGACPTRNALASCAVDTPETWVVYQNFCDHPDYDAIREQHGEDTGGGGDPGLLDLLCGGAATSELHGSCEG